MVKTKPDAPPSEPEFEKFAMSFRYDGQIIADFSEFFLSSMHIFIIIIIIIACPHTICSLTLTLNSRNVPCVEDARAELDKVIAKDTKDVC